MKRRIAYGLTALAVAALIAAGLWGAAWLAGTTEGARWLLDAVSRRTPLKVSARTIEGRLLDRLQLGEVRLALAPFEATIGHLDMAWQPLHLLSGRVHVETLTLDQVQILDGSPDTPPDLAWPRISGSAALFDGRIDHLQVKGLSYGLRNENPMRISEIAAVVDWRRGILSLSGLSASAADGRITVKIGAGFDRPSLDFDLTVAPVAAVAGMDSLFLQGRFLPGLGSEQLAGEFSLAGASGGKKILALAGEAAMTRKAFLLRNLRLTQPGRKGEVTGSGSVTPAKGAPRVSLALSAAGLDLAPEIKLATNLAGALTVTGTPAAWQGAFRLENRGRGWRRAHLAGSFAGDGRGVKFSGLKGRWLSGSLQGRLDLAWGREVALKGTLRGLNLNPSALDADWAGVVNFDLDGGVSWKGREGARGKVNARLLESRLHGQALTGEIRADFAGSELHIGRLTLKGRGFDIQGSGNLAQRLDFTAQVSDLGRLVPRTKGNLSAEGWVRLKDGRPEGALTGKGGKFAAGGVTIVAADFTARLGEGKGFPLRLGATLRKASWDRFEVDSATLDADGTLSDHRVRTLLRGSGAGIQVDLAGGYDRGIWQGRIVGLAGRDRIGPWTLDAPAGLAVSADRVALSPLVLTGEKDERFEIAGEWGETSGGSFQAQGRGLNLARAKPWLPGELGLEGRLTGRAAGRTLPGERIDLTGSLFLGQGKIRWKREGQAMDADLRTAELSWGWLGPIDSAATGSAAGKLSLSGRIVAAGSVTLDGQAFLVEKGTVSLDSNERGLRTAVDLALSNGGAVQGSFASPAAALAALPETGEIEARWSGIDLALFKPWLPPELLLEGRLAGRATGNLLAGYRLALKGDASLAGGKVRRVRPEGEVNVNLKLASLNWEWRDDALRGDISLALAEQGEARGSFQLPIPARLPTALDNQGPLRATLTGKIRENGLLGSLFPGLVRESRGELAGKLAIGGTIREPVIGGSLKLSGAGAYLPTAGIRIHDVRLEAALEKDLIRIDSFRAESGAGHIEGKALIRLKAWQVMDYQGSLNGERFQAVHLPEMEILASPRLTFTGTPEKLSLRGEIHLPEALVSGAPARDVVLASRDVVLEGAVKPVEKTLPLALDVRIRLILGQRVLAKIAGIDARLGGAIDLEFQSLDKITSRGEIRVEKGRYKTYGVDLEIVRGRLFYAGGSISRPTLDLLALRTIGEVKAGVTAGGVLNAPLVKLYAEPVMADADILSYILFGHPLSNSSNQEQTGMMAQAAGILLSKGQSVVLQEQIKKRLGLSTLELQSGSVDAAGRMGYKEIRATPGGVAQASQAAGVSDTMLTVGKYLTPKLYFSYGRSIFTGSNLFRLRYDIFKQWQIETQTGSESGVDLYYRIDFK